MIEVVLRGDVQIPGLSGPCPTGPGLRPILLYHKAPMGSVLRQMPPAFRFRNKLQGQIPGYHPAARKTTRRMGLRSIPCTRDPSSSFTIVAEYGDLPVGIGHGFRDRKEGEIFRSRQEDPTQGHKKHQKAGRRGSEGGMLPQINAGLSRGSPRGWTRNFNLTSPNGVD